jgi:hypothetical protein
LQQERAKIHPQTVDTHAKVLFIKIHSESMKISCYGDDKKRKKYYSFFTL